MLKRFLFFFYLFSVVFPIFSATQRQSDSGSSLLGKPSVKFKSWQIGRSDKSTDSSNDNPTSFITSTQDKCHFTASVGYDGNQGDSVSPIDPSTVSWTVPNADPSSMKLVTSQKNWSGTKHPSKLDPGTSFNVVGTISVPAYTPTAKPDICKDENNHRRHERTPLHRGNKKLGFTLKFTADTEDGQEVETELVLKADDIDQVRQEYVDLNRPIPKRSEFKSEDTYDFGHYEKMLNEGLSGWYQKWINQMNTDYRGNKAALTKSNFTLNSGYRNPHHNHHHAGSSGLSPHMYGYALDVAGKDLDGNGTLDRQDMVDAAYAIPQPNRARWSQLYSGTTHVHADWAPNSPVRWAARKKTAKDARTFSLPPQGTDSALQSSNNNNNNPNNGNAGNPGSSETTPQTRPCGHSLTASGDHSLQASCSTDSSCIATNFYLCSHTHTYPQVTGACGHTYPSNESFSHREVAFPCRSHLYYVCSEPSTSETRRHHRKMLPCGEHLGRLCAASSYHTQSVSCPQENGVSCSSGTYYQCSSHTHSYPSSNNNNDGNSGDGNSGNSAICSAGHTYNPNNSSLVNRHRVRTCMRPACGQSWQLCSGGKPSSCGASSSWRCRE